MARPPSHQAIPLGADEHGTPYLVPYFSTLQPNSGHCVLVMPGGGYGILSQHEGEGYANFLNLIGLHAFVLHYRLGTQGHRHPAMLEDAVAGIRHLRLHAGEWGLRENRIAVMGSSAGGHLAACLMTLFSEGDPQAVDPAERLSSRPDLGILAYPVISSGEHAHAGSFENLLGPTPSPEDLRLLSPDQQIRPDTPPGFVWHTLEDTVVPAENSLRFAQAMRAKGIPCELHLFEQGGHGIGMQRPHPWMELLHFWLRGRGWVTGQ